VDAALWVFDREGYDGFSMRAVADELGTGPATLYWHVKNKDELLDLILDRVIGEVEIPDPDPEHWQEQFKELGRDMRRVMNRHRDIARVTLGRIPVGPNALRSGERTLAILRAGGVSDQVAAWALDLGSLYVGALAFEESLGLISPSGEEQAPDEVLEMIRGYYASLPAEQFPNTLAILDKLFAGDVEERFEFGLDVLVKGLAAASSDDRGV
jgi:AcrR family transcriptional regulator